MKEIKKLTQLKSGHRDKWPCAFSWRYNVIWIKQSLYSSSDSLDCESISMKITPRITYRGDRGWALMLLVSAMGPRGTEERSCSALSVYRFEWTRRKRLAPALCASQEASYTMLSLRLEKLKLYFQNENGWTLTKRTAFLQFSPVRDLNGAKDKNSGLSVLRGKQRKEPKEV